MLDLARERGVHDMSIRTLAGAVRAAPGSLAYHYRTKDSVFATCARFLGLWLARDLEERLAAPLLAHEEPMAAVLSGRPGPAGAGRADCGAEELAIWAMFKTLAMTLLQPEGTLTKDAALAAIAWAER
jgi:AcrR family transcriptional regulator